MIYLFAITISPIPFADVHLNGWLTAFVEDYRDLLSSDVQVNSNALTTFFSVVAAVKRSPYKLYLFIDEYDNFANEVMMGAQGENQKRYWI